MITVTICRESSFVRSFRVEGHAGYADEGYDIICSAVSVLAINTANSIEKFTDDRFSAKQSDGCLYFRFESGPSKASRLLTDSMILGLTQIQKDYGDAYIKIEYEEV